NAAGEVNGVPFVQFNEAVTAGQPVTVMIEYFVPADALIPLTHVFVPLSSPVLPDPMPMGSIVTDGFRVSRTPFENRSLVEWKSNAGERYWVQYSDDGGSTWTTSLASLSGTGLRIVWLDSGPPKTTSDSKNNTTRQYRVIVEN
ncbi:MAG: hypothetical protein ACPGVU_08365, partial [Limisphaerales bacterium]